MNAIEAYVREEEEGTIQACAGAPSCRGGGEDADTLLRVEEVNVDRDATISSRGNNNRGSSSTSYHELYLPAGHETYMQPIIFGDGMDYAECNLYYQTREAQTKGGVLRRQRHDYETTAAPATMRLRRLSAWDSHGSAAVTVAATTKTADPKKVIKPIIRYNNNNNTKPKNMQQQHQSSGSTLSGGDPWSPRKIVHNNLQMCSALPRRCSFSELPADSVLLDAREVYCSSGGSSGDENGFAFCQRRSQSVRHIMLGAAASSQHQPAAQRVSFQERVMVHTIDPVADIPYETRRNLWMTKLEMLQALQDAAFREWVEERARQSAEFARLFPLEDDEDNDNEVDGGMELFDQEEMDDEDEFMQGISSIQEQRPMGVC